jgi:anti-sigma-K factor RskA
MDRNRFDDLKEAYVLKALPEEERREFEAYLAANPELQSEIEELSAVANLLALACEEQEPPKSLRKNLLRQIEPEARRQSVPQPSLADRVREAFGWRPVAAGLAALAFVGLLVWNITLMGQLQEDEQQTYDLVATDTAAPAGQVVHLEETGEAVLVAQGLPELPEDRTYEIWVIRGDEDPIPSGLFKPQNGRAAAPITTPIEGADVIAVTEEPAGGSPAPTSDPIYAAEL